MREFVVFGMTGVLLCSCRNCLKVVHRKGITGEVQEDILQDASGARWKDEPVAVGPFGFCGLYARNFVQRTFTGASAIAVPG